MNGAQVRDLEGAVCDKVLTLHAHGWTDRQTDAQICDIPLSYKIVQCHDYEQTHRAQPAHRLHSDNPYYTGRLFIAGLNAAERTTWLVQYTATDDTVGPPCSTVTAVFWRNIARGRGHVAGLHNVKGHQYGDDAK